METIICTTCGVEQINPQRETCPICLEERQYVNPTGQTWTTLDAMQTLGTYQNVISDDGAGVYAIQTTPAFGIGQTAYLVQGNRSTCYGTALHILILQRKSNLTN